MARLFNDATPDFLQRDVAGPSAPFSVSAWGRSDDATLNQAIYFSGDKDVGNQNWQLRFSGAVAGDNIQWNAREGPGGFAVTTTGFTAGTWHHVAAVEASTTDRRVFIDGGSKGTNATDKSPAGADRVTIGRLGDSTPEQEFSGDIAHVALWNVALTDQEIATLAAGVSPLRVRRDALIAYWPINGVSPEAEVVQGATLEVNGTPSKSEEPPIPNSIVAA